MCKKRAKKSCDKTQEKSSLSVRPKRLAAIRQGEKLVVWTTRLNDEHADWFDNEDSDVEDVCDHILACSQNVIPVIDLDAYMRNPFENDDNVDDKSQI